MKSVALMALTAVAGVSLASFDVTLLPGADGRIYRYDPENNVSLGSFNAGGTVRAIELVPGTSQAGVLRIGDQALYNIWTGQRIAQGAGSIGVTDLQWQPSANRFDAYWFGTGTTYIDQFSYPNMAYGLGPVVSNDFLQTMFRIGGSRYIGVQSGSGTLLIRSFDTVSGANTPYTFSWGTAPRISNLVTGGSNEALFASVLSPGQLVFSSIVGAGGNLIGFGNLGSIAAPGLDLTQPFYLNPSHSGYYLYGRNAATGNWLVFDVGRTSQAGFATFGSNATNIPYSAGRPSTFLAPEPGTMLALGAGVAALLRKRRKRSS